MGLSTLRPGSDTHPVYPHWVIVCYIIKHTLSNNRLVGKNVRSPASLAKKNNGDLIHGGAPRRPRGDIHAAPGGQPVSDR